MKTEAVLKGFTHRIYIYIYLSVLNLLVRGFSVALGKCNMEGQTRRKKKEIKKHITDCHSIAGCHISLFIAF